MDKCIYCGSPAFVRNGRRQSGDQEYHCRKCGCGSYFTAGSNPDYHWSHFDADTMRLATLWYFRFHLNLRNLAEIMFARGIDISHQTIGCWVRRLGPELGRKARSLWNLRRTVSCYVDETYVKVNGEWKYLYRDVDRNGEVLDVMLSARRSKKAARRLFAKTLKAMGIKPERIYTDKNSAFPDANDEILGAKHTILRIKVTPIERSHVPVKRRYHTMLGFMNFDNAFHFTRDLEYIRGYVGGTNVSNRRTCAEMWNRVLFLVDKKTA